MKRFLSLLLCALLLSLAACSDPMIGGGNGAEPAVNDDPEAASGSVIELKGDRIDYKGRGAAVNGSVVTIGTAGEYTVRGTLDDGRIVVDTKESPGKVTLFLDGASITCLTDSAIYVKQAKELKLVLVAGSRNTVVSGTEADAASYDETRQGAAIFSEDDLDIQGGGSLTVLGYFNNGITCKDDLKIKDGTLWVKAVHNGIRASESVTLLGGAVTVEAGNDGVKTSSAKKAGKGFVSVEGGSLTVSAQGDGVAAEAELRVSGGTVEVSTAGDPSAASCKGLKGKAGVILSGGSIKVDAEDHAVRSGAALTVSGASCELVSRGGKGLSAETELLVESGTLFVDAADDGLVCADTVRITGGELTVRAGADGIQGGKKATGIGDTVGTVAIEGGRTAVSAFNKPIDAKASFRISGGTLFACGKGKNVRPTGGCAFLIFSAQGQAGAELGVDDGLGFTLRSAYPFSTVLYADGALQEGQRCTLSGAAKPAEAVAAR